MPDNDHHSREVSRVRAPGTPQERLARRTAVLDRRSTHLVERASDAGVTIDYLGIAPLFSQARAYPAATTDWVVAPVTDLNEAVVPKAELGALRRLVEAGVDFPLLYIAHEILKGRISVPTSDGQPVSPRPTTLDRASATNAIGPIPPPPAALALAERLGRSAHHLLRGLAMAVPIAGAIIAAPIVIAGAAAAALVGGLDPIVFGVIPAGPATEGQPAAWYILAEWEWPENAGPGGR